MCASTGVLTWSRTSRSAGLPRKKMPRMRSFFSRPGGFGEKRACNESLEISASPFTTRPARCCGVCATLWEPGHSTIRTLEKSLRSATLPFWLMAMRLCVAMSIAAIVSRHPELDWQRAKRHAAGWCAAHALSGTATIRECVGNSCANSTGSRRREGRSGSQPVSPSCSMVAASWLCAARFVAARRIPHEHAWRGLAGAGYLPRLSLPPTDEDWEKGAQEGRWWLWDGLLRPTTDQEVWAGPPSPSLLNRKATKKPARG